MLKPVRGLDPAFREAIRSQAEQQYPEFEILFGVTDPDDAAVPEIQRLAREFPNVRMIESRSSAPNGKVGVLMDLQQHARYDILVVNDADIRVQPDYLAAVTAPLADPKVGLVTCLYRAHADSFAARFEALGISTEFAPSAFVARMVGVDEFGLGSTLAFRKADLERIGGFAAVADFIADDYHLGRLIHQLGLRCVLSEVVVDTHLGAATWRDAWRHQLRWARTIRVSKPGGYAGLPVTYATLWAVVAAAAGHWRIASALLALRMVMALTAGLLVMRDREAARLAWLIPARDLWGVAVWLAGYFGRTVWWRGWRMRLTADGRIVP